MRARVRRAVGALATVEAYADSADAARAIASRAHALVISDPHGAGGARVRRHALRAHVPLVVVASQLSLEALLDLIAEGASDFIHPRDTAASIAEVVRRTLEVGDVRRELRAMDRDGGVANTVRYERVLRRVSRALERMRVTKRAYRRRLQRTGALTA